MSDATLLVFGCVVTFIAVAGAYVYIRESFAYQAEVQAKQEIRREPKLRKVV